MATGSLGWSQSISSMALLSIFLELVRRMLLRNLSDRDVRSARSEVADHPRENTRIEKIARRRDGNGHRIPDFGSGTVSISFSMIASLVTRSDSA